jgi:16S rRNA (guanine527-N7)-methyltransferase
MTEEEAREWIRRNFDVSRETSLTVYANLLRVEATNQNLVSAASMDALWARHFVDSAQLIALSDDARKGSWVDIGSGAGLPGLVVALLTERPVVLVEPRRRRADFLRFAAAALRVDHRVSVEQSRIEVYRPPAPAAVISARAVAELSQLLAGALHCTDSSTIWLLPKGEGVQSEVEAARRTWQGMFHVEPSITSPKSGIVVARKVRRA